MECFYEEACRGGVLFAQYEYDVLLSNRQERHWQELGARYLEMAAKEVLLRRQCKLAHIEVPQGHRSISAFFYNSIPDNLTETATDKYFWEHLDENLKKIDQYTWKEILEGPKVLLIRGRGTQLKTEHRKISSIGVSV